jgi:hypothetical protein
MAKFKKIKKNTNNRIIKVCVDISSFIIYLTYINEPNKNTSAYNNSTSMKLISLPKK